MTDDILTRLRQGCLDEVLNEQLMEQAADEIERLRKENEQLRNGNNLLAAMFTGKVVRGD